MTGGGFMIWLTGGTLLRLVAFAGMGAGVYFCFKDIKGEYRCDNSMEVWDGDSLERPTEACLLTTAPVGKAQLNARAKKFAEKRLEIVTAANQRKLKIELEHQVAQMQAEKAVMDGLLADFAETCQADTEALVTHRLRWETEQLRNGWHTMEHNWDNLLSNVLALSPYQNGTDLCNTTRWANDHEYNWCKGSTLPHMPTAQLDRSWVIAAAGGCSLEHSKLLRDDLAGLSFDAAFDRCSKAVRWDSACGPALFWDDVHAPTSCWCVKRPFTCRDHQNASMGGLVFENQARKDAWVDGDIGNPLRLYNAGAWQGAGVQRLSAGDHSQLACQHACFSTAGCHRWQWQAAYEACQGYFVAPPAVPPLGPPSLPQGWVSGRAALELCKDLPRDHLHMASTCRSQGITVDVRCGWKLKCDDPESADFCNTYHPGICNQAETRTSTTTQTTTTLHDFCQFRGDVTFQLRLDGNEVEHNGASMLGVNHPSFAAEGPMHGTELSTFVFGVHGSYGGDATKAVLVNWATGAVMAEVQDATNLTVDCGALGGCGYSGEAHFRCSGTAVDYDFQGCRTTPSARWACYQQRLATLTSQKNAAFEDYEMHWARQNASFEGHVNESRVAIEAGVETAKSTLFRMQGTQAAVDLLGSEIDRVSEHQLDEIAKDFAEEYLVDVGERYRIGCAHRTAANEWGMGADVEPSAENIKSYVESSGDLSGDFLLHPCTPADEAIGRCSSNASLARLDMSKMWGLGEEPLAPPMKMPALSPTPVMAQRSACLQLPCLAAPERQTCLAKVVGHSVRLSSTSGKYLRQTSSNAVLTDFPAPGLAWAVQPAAGGTVRLIAESGEALSMDADGSVSLQPLDTFDSNQIWMMNDAREGAVYITSSHNKHLMEVGPAPTNVAVWPTSPVSMACPAGLQHCLGVGEELGWRQMFFAESVPTPFLKLCSSSPDAMQADSGNRTVGTGWARRCDQGVLAMDRVVTWERYTFDPVSRVGALEPVEASISCTRAFDHMRERWDRWSLDAGAKMRAATEKAAYDAQRAAMQDAWREWVKYERGSSIYLAEKVHVSECAHSPSVFSESRMMTSGWGNVGPKTEACRMAKCEIGQCVVKRAQCILGEPSGEVAFECADPVHYSRKALDELLMGIFGFVLSLVVFIVSRCTDDPAGERRRSRAAVMPEDGEAGFGASPRGRGARSTRATSPTAWESNLRGAALGDGADPRQRRAGSTAEEDALKALVHLPETSKEK